MAGRRRGDRLGNRASPLSRGREGLPRAPGRTSRETAAQVLSSLKPRRESLAKNEGNYGPIFTRAKYKYTENEADPSQKEINKLPHGLLELDDDNYGVGFALDKRLGLNP